MGGETTYCSFFSTHFFSWSAQRHAHFWGHRWLRRMWGLKGDIFQKGVHSVCNIFKSSLLPSVAASLSLLGLADVWGSFLGSLGRQRATCSQCQPDFRGNSYERRIALHKETEPLSLPATFRFSFSYSLISSSNSLFVIFGFYSSLRLSPADVHPQITLCIKWMSSALLV